MIPLDPGNVMLSTREVDGEQGIEGGEGWKEEGGAKNPLPGGSDGV